MCGWADETKEWAAGDPKADRPATEKDLGGYGEEVRDRLWGKQKTNTADGWGRPKWEQAQNHELDQGEEVWVDRRGNAGQKGNRWCAQQNQPQLRGT